MLLVIEDSPTQVSMISHLAEKHGANFVVVQNWMQAVLHLANVSLVLIDWVLSDGDNAESCGALDYLRKNEIPHAIWSDFDFSDRQFDCEIVGKPDVQRLNSLIEEYC
tara:strand:+ start:418 stop:741 length:324 start_codon:yes stop_codon:yes gene_type:complete